MLFQWFNATAYLPNDKTGEALEKLKSEYVWQEAGIIYLRNLCKFYWKQAFQKCEACFELEIALYFLFSIQF